MAINYDYSGRGEYEDAYNAFGGKDATNSLLTTLRGMGLSEDEINSNLSPYYKTTTADTNATTGYDANTVSNYSDNAGLGMFGQPDPQVQPQPIPPQPPVYQEPPPQPIYDPVYQPPQPPVYQPPVTQKPIDTGGTEVYNPINFVPEPVVPPEDPNAVQRRIIEEERKRNLESGLPSLGAGAANVNSAPKPVDLGGNELSGNILAGASWNSTNETLGNELTALNNQPTLNTAVGGATSADTLKQLNDFTAAGGTFKPGSTVFLQTGGIDMINGVDDNTISNNIDQIISTLDGYGVNVVLTASPRAGSLADVSSNNFERGPASFYSNIAKNHKNVAMVDSMGNILQDKTLLRDTLHTNAAGEKVYNKSVIDAYKSLVNKGADPNTAITLAKQIVGETPPANTGATLPVAPEETKYGTVTPYTTSQIKDYVSGVMGDASLTSFERTNKIMEAAQKAGVSQSDLTAIYGKDVVDPVNLKDYGTGIKSYITSTLTNTTKSDFDKVAEINQYAKKYGLDASEIAEYSGLNKKGVDQMFTAFDAGLANLAKGWDTAKTKAGTDTAALSTAEVNKAKTMLALQSKYQVSDDDLAKAMGSTAKEINDYLTPVKEAPKTLESLMGNSTMSGADIRSKIDELKANPAVNGIYSAALEKFSEKASKDYSGEYGGKKFESLNPIAVSNVLSQLKAQQEAGTAQYYQGGAKDGKKGGFGSLDSMTEDMAKNLVAAGITDIRQVGEKTITETDEDGNETKRTIVVNKVTGEPLSKASNYSERTTGNSWSGTFKGKGNTGYNVQFKDGNPVFYTTGASSSDMQELAPLLAMASFIPGAAPFVAAINAAYAASEGNWKQAILSALPAAGPLANMAGASASTVANIGTASKIANVANAIDNKDILGLAMSGTGLASDQNLFGESAFNPKANVLGDFSTKDLLSGASIAKALDNKDLTSLANIGAQMSGNENAVTAAKGLAIVKALESKNPMAIAQVIQKLNLTKDAIGRAGGGLTSLPGLIKNGNKNTLTDKSAFDGLNGSLLAKMLNKQPPAIRSAMLKKMTQTA